MQVVRSYAGRMKQKDIIGSGRGWGGGEERRSYRELHSCIASLSSTVETVFTLLVSLDRMMCPSMAVTGWLEIGLGRRVGFGHAGPFRCSCFLPLLQFVLSEHKH